MAFSGLRCMLVQEDNLGKTYLVMAISSGITNVMTRYSVYELELSPLAWALE